MLELIWMVEWVERVHRKVSNQITGVLVSPLGLLTAAGYPYLPDISLMLTRSPYGRSLRNFHLFRHELNLKVLRWACVITLMNMQ